MTEQPEPIRKSSLPTIPAPEWEFHTWFPHPDGGGDMVPGQRQRGVLVRRRVSYGDWEAVRPGRWADEAPTDARAAVPAGQAPATDLAEAIASCPGRELDPSPCRCPCYGCKHHCAAHNPEALPDAEPAAEQTALRDRIAKTLARTELKPPFPHCLAMADAVLAALPAPVDRAAVLREAAEHLDQLPLTGVEGGIRAALTAELRRVAAETRNTTPPAGGAQQAKETRP